MQKSQKKKKKTSILSWQKKVLHTWTHRVEYNEGLASPRRKSPSQFC